MSVLLGKFVTRHWLAVIVGWVLLVALLYAVAPNWDDVTRDGDLAFLPPQMPSVRGEQLLSKAFPRDRAKSEIAVFVGRESGKLQGDELAVAYDLARQFKNLHGVAALTRAKQYSAEAQQRQQEGRSQEAALASQRADAALSAAEAALDEAVQLDGSLADYWAKKDAAAKKKALPPDTVRRHQRLAAPYHNRSLVYLRQGKRDDAATDARVARELDREFERRGPQPYPAQAERLPLLDVWTWQDEVFGEKLSKPQVRTMLLHLSNEFMAVDNIEVLDYLETILDGARATLLGESRERLQIGYSGSAAVGGDLLRAARDSIANTELFTVVLVVLILSVVYRSPLLVVMPVLTIAASVIAATSIVALLTQVGLLPGFEWWTFKVFTTTKVFIVVILYGSGTDFYLFLVARYREELEHGHEPRQALARSLGAVGTALTASAVTTILGLGTMVFADFGKFKNSGPSIGLCLVVTLLACLTLAPALLCAFGKGVFWPFGAPRPKLSSMLDRGADASDEAGESWFWGRLATWTIARPGLILVVSMAVLLIPAIHGLRHGGRITYDFLSQLPKERPSRQGAEFMQRHFDIGEAGPLTVVVFQPAGEFDTKAGRQRIADLTRELYVEGVTAVRSVSDPLGKFPPGKRVGLFDRNSWLKMIASPHPETQKHYVATEGDYAGDVTRLDLLLQYDPFSLEAEQVLERVEQQLQAIRDDANSPWHNATFVYSGMSADLRDLKRVTQSDNRRIQILVVLAVFAVLLVMLRRPLVSLYMIATVCFSYYITMGVTVWFFAWLYGPDFLGLDWKVPLFLFVILVAVGQDYNIYLVTRVSEEQARLGPLPGLRYAVLRTGGIITSCGVIMAGTFISMTSGTWEPYLSWLPGASQLLGTGANALAAIVQLGFSLSFGILLDTFVVRTVLLPAFLALLHRWSEKRPLPPAGAPAPHRRPVDVSVAEPAQK
ncbi:MAG: MMPL family transporter [Pirellulaceae bacterium]|jgi:RND superfamily putative drug exporter|nr:MMPL family transporter [Pirellulaceae bacterium]